MEKNIENLLKELKSYIPENSSPSEIISLTTDFIKNKNLSLGDLMKLNKEVFLQKNLSETEIEDTFTQQKEEVIAEKTKQDFENESNSFYKKLEDLVSNSSNHTHNIFTKQAPKNSPTLTPFFKNIKDYKDFYLIELSLPGIEKENIQIKIDDAIYVDIKQDGLKDMPHRYVTQEFKIPDTHTFKFDFIDGISNTTEYYSDYNDGLLVIKCKKQKKSGSQFLTIN